ncbi:hypothetical protein BDF20DRAFT_837296 [Mycotypha africana]|uniref:uncharacterized protein n=1 Tax=Mycotypha africana TaxID=64632 RepID=UPI002300476B|nr:uncharacterized protein BDF20DRAFT_837296 [Mycotypha africana]KAI8973344.1 hypothetical protein BDF20DRAFT_837296 [Mycotypha africana]
MSIEIKLDDWRGILMFLCAILTRSYSSPPKSSILIITTFSIKTTPILQICDRRGERNHLFQPIQMINVSTLYLNKIVATAEIDHAVSVDFKASDFNAVLQS